MTRGNRGNQGVTIEVTIVYVSLTHILDMVTPLHLKRAHSRDEGKLSLMKTYPLFLGGGKCGKTLRFFRDVVFRCNRVTKYGLYRLTRSKARLHLGYTFQSVDRKAEESSDQDGIEPRGARCNHGE